MKEIIFVTSNLGKVANARLHLEKIGIKVIQKNIDVIEPYENDIEFISAEKARQAYFKLNSPVITQDSGFYIEAFPGKPNFPGAFPKRDLLEKMGIDGLLDVMKDEKNRSCYFKQCLSFFDGENMHQFEDIVSGSLATKPRGTEKSQKLSDLWNVFIPQGFNKTISELSSGEYYSWQGEMVTAFEKFAEFLKENNLLDS